MVMSAINLVALAAPRLEAHFCDPSGLTVPAGVVAAGRECSAFRLWIDDLPESGNDVLLQLRGCGFAYDLAELEAQLRQALRCGPAGPLARIVGQRVLELLASHHGAVCILLEEGVGSHPAEKHGPL
jgi:hypothetical protein